VWQPRQNLAVAFPISAQVSPVNSELFRQVKVYFDYALNRVAWCVFDSDAVVRPAAYEASDFVTCRTTLVVIPRNE
jgi:hypothetical protein